MACVGLFALIPFGRAGWVTAAQSAAGPWQLTGWRTVPAGHADQGLATVTLPHGGERIVMRGNSDVSESMENRGWLHIGDPGSIGGYTLDAYQGAPSMRAKLFVLTTSDGRRSEWQHRLAPGEAINNSFVAIAPSGNWFLSGEWGTMTRLLEFPTPGWNSAARPGCNLPLVATIRLTRPVRDVQGCSFATPAQLVCATNDPSEDLFRVPRQLIAINFTHPLDGHTQIGVPLLLGTVPQVSWCGISETEGLSVHDGRLLLIAHERGLCADRSVLFTYRLRARPAVPPGDPAGGSISHRASTGQASSVTLARGTLAA